MTSRFNLSKLNQQKPQTSSPKRCVHQIGAMLEDALLDVSKRGEIVIDPFCGSGSTLLAAETTGRLCRAIEIDGLYCDLTIRRWQELTGQEAILVATGESFGSIAARNTDDGGAHG